jgi:hypothetical protein
MPDVETPIVTEESALVLKRLPGAGKSMIEIWLDGRAEEAEAKLQLLARMLETLRKHAIGQSYPSDWVIHTSTDRQTGEVIKQVGYLQDSGCERAGKIFGIELAAPSWIREDMPDGTYSYVFKAGAYSRVTHESIDYVEGSRWSGDDFFQRGLDKNADPPEKVNPNDVRKAAHANLHGRAVRALAGLSAVPLDKLRDAGLNVDRCLFVAYSSGAKGGTSAGATLGSSDVKVAFGRGAGKTPAELEDGDLAWYIKAYTENVNDPGKEKYKKANQRVLDALKAEAEKRAKGAQHAAETATEAPAAGGNLSATAPSETQQTPRGKKTTEVWGKAQTHGGKDAIALLKAISREVVGEEIGGMSAFSDEQLEKMTTVPDEVWKSTATALAGAKGGKK